MEFREQQAIYLQIADFMIENILSEKWKSGDRIPSVRELAVNLEVNPNTVMRTFSYLQDRDIIFNKRGIGYFVSGDGLKKAKNLKREAFIHDDLPVLFKTMELLDINIEDLKEIYVKNYSE
jgi:DNA-binding transcriptional regulator YhcF (GntR family)